MKWSKLFLLLRKTTPEFQYDIASPSTIKDVTFVENPISVTPLFLILEVSVRLINDFDLLSSRKIEIRKKKGY